jgi:AcrR family transcriptional regulator
MSMRKSAVAKGPASPTAKSRTEPRGARRRRKTRARLLRASLELMASRDLEGVAINEITEAADVGFGTFYNYFESKEAIYEALIVEVVEGFGSALDQIAEHAEDPAEVLAASVRCTLDQARKEPLWGSFLVRSGFSGRALERGLGPRMLRDVKQGIRAGRFQADDLPATVVAVRGAVLSAIDAQVELAQRNPKKSGFAASLGVDPETLPTRAATILLRLLGLDAEDAREVANRPLPKIELSDSIRGG